MRLLRHDAAAGLLHLQIDDLDDLWTLRNLIQPGDLVTALTQRTAESAGDKLRGEKMEKRAMRIGVRAETVEWHDFDDHLRVLGPIETGPQDHGRHHTLVLRAGEGADVVIEKRGALQPWHLRLVADAEKATQRPRVLLLALDDAEAQFASLKSYGLQFLGSLPSGIQGKRFAGGAGQKEEFYAEALRSLKAFRVPSDTPVLVVGPGWWREEFLEHVRRKDPVLARGVQTEGTAHGGRTGLNEALRSGLLARVQAGHRVQEETDLVEDLLERIAKGAGFAAYGPADVASAVQAGACETLLVADVEARSGRFDGLLRAAEAARAGIHVVSTGHEAGERLHRMGGLAALLRFPFQAAPDS